VADAHLYVSKVGDIIKLGGYDWRVLALVGGNALLLSDKILEYKDYAAYITSKTWRASGLRQYLNNDFYNKTFSAEEKKRIFEVYSVEDYLWSEGSWGIEAEAWNKTAPPEGLSGLDLAFYNALTAADARDDETKDRVFLLSIQEVQRYFGRSADAPAWDENMTAEDFFDAVVDRMSRISDQYNSARIAYDKNTGAAHWWWLREDGNTCYGALVQSDGVIVKNTRKSEEFDSLNGGVRPALILKLQ